MSKVYHVKNKTKDYSELSKIALDLLKKIEKDTNFIFNNDIPIKAHFGEKGNDTFIPALCYDDIIDYLKEKNISPSFIETNVLYRGSRTTRQLHLELAKSHGFDRIPVIIADGEMGTEYNEIEIDKDYFTSCKIGKAYSSYNQFLVISHFKGHISAGFGGALKQLAMGFASRGGKLAQHSGISPVINPDKCISCELCLEKCDFDAIYMNDTAHIDGNKCTGCAGCIAVCPQGAISNRWDGSNFLEKLAEYAYAAALGKDNIYITFLLNVTKECDCIGKHMDLVAENIGVFASKDPVALDSACLDMLQHETGEKMFDKGRVSLLHAEKIGLGSTDYELVELKIK